MSTGKVREKTRHFDQLVDPSDDDRELDSISNTLRKMKHLLNERIVMGKGSLEKVTFDYSIREYTPIAWRLKSYLVHTAFSLASANNYIPSISSKTEFEVDFDQTTQIPFLGIVAYVYKKQNVLVSYDGNNAEISIKGPKKYEDELLELLKASFKTLNPYVGKINHVSQNTSGDTILKIRQKPTITLNKVILSESLKQDIHDNTVTSLQLGQSNGILLYGDPGVGKSLICEALSAEFVNENIPIFLITSDVDLPLIRNFCETFFTKVVFIFEDLDTLTQNRESYGSSTQLSDFLQFFSGVTHNDFSQCIIATTNYLEHLDPAIRNRPLRFNRKFEFKFPTQSELKQMVALYFSDKDLSVIPDNLYGEMKKAKFSGAHIKEIRRTCDMLSTKPDHKDLPFLEVYMKAYTTIKNNFGQTLSSIGFIEEKE